MLVFFTVERLPFIEGHFDLRISLNKPTEVSVMQALIFLFAFVVIPCPCN